MAWILFLSRSISLAYNRRHTTAAYLAFLERSGTERRESLRERSKGRNFNPDLVLAGLKFVEHPAHSSRKLSIWRVDPPFIAFEFGQNIMTQQIVHNFWGHPLVGNFSQSTQKRLLFPSGITVTVHLSHGRPIFMGDLRPLPPSCQLNALSP